MDLPQPPPDQDQRNIIDKLAQFVARNGPEFEQMTKTKQKNNPKFSFLFGGEHYHYYQYKVQAEQAIQRQRGGGFGGGASTGGGFGGGAPAAPGWAAGGASSGWSAPPTGGQPRPLMEIQTYAPPSTGTPPPTAAPTGFAPPTIPAVNIAELQEQIKSLTQQQKTLQEQITQSENNLAAQQQVTFQQQQIEVQEAIQRAALEHLELLASDTGISLDEIQIVVQPIIDSCTKDSISSGKSWIFTHATNHDNNKLIAHYMKHRVVQEDASFTTKLHVIYLMNDVLHHCIRKNAEDIKQAFESVAVEMFSSAQLSAVTDDKKSKLDKLINLWEQKKVFSVSTLNKMRDFEASWKAYKDQLKEDYKPVIEQATAASQQTYDNYAQQHKNFVTHATATVQNYEQQKTQLQEQIKAAEAAARLPPPQVVTPVVATPPAWNGSSPTPTTSASAPTPKRGRSSRWDTAGDSKAKAAAPTAPPAQWAPPMGGAAPPMGATAPPIGATAPPMGATAPPPGLPSIIGPDGLPDFSRPPPGFLPPPSEPELVPTMPYYDLPAGLMVPLIKLDDAGYKPLDPKKIRLPPPTPPTERLLQALDMFYAPPSHDRPRDPDGWEIVGLYEWTREKNAALKRKQEDIADGRRERSPTVSPEPYSRSSTPEAREKSPPPAEKSPPRRKRYRSRTRSRSGSRESTPDRKPRRRYSRSPEGGYSLPSYLTKRSPSPPPTRKSDVRRSPSPPSYSGFGGAGGARPADSRLDSSNKGHQMLQKMGWKGSGLGQTETGIVEPVSGGEVRDRVDQYKGVGSETDPFEAFRKNKAGSFYTRMRERDPRK